MVVYLAVEFLQHLLDLGEFLLRLVYRCLQSLKRDVVVWLVVCSGFILFCTKVLDLLTAVLDFGESERG